MILIIASSNPAFESNVTAILEKFREVRKQADNKPLIIHFYHVSDSGNPRSPFAPGSDGLEFHAYVRPDKSSELVMSKSVNSCFIGTKLEEVLREHEIRRLYVVGMTTDHCVSTTVRMAGNLKVTDWIDEDGQKQRGDGPFLVTDATAAHAKGGFNGDLVHAVHAESLKEFATVVKTSEVLESLSKAISR